MKLIPTRLRHHIYKSTAKAAVFGTGVIADDAELGDGVEFGIIPACSPIDSCTLAPFRKNPFADSRWPLIENWPALLLPATGTVPNPPPEVLLAGPLVVTGETPAWVARRSV